VIAEVGGARLCAPVTSRGEAVGVLELGLESFPVEQTVADAGAGSGTAPSGGRGGASAAGEPSTPFGVGRRVVELVVVVEG
jgi:hypothetical protein